MKKKKVVKGILIGLAIVAVIAIATLAYISLNAVHTREKIDNVEDVEIISEENLLMTYEISRKPYYSFVEGSNCYIEGQNMVLGIFADRSVYCFYTVNSHFNAQEWHDYMDDIKSVYYMGRVSTIDFWRLLYHIGSVDSSVETEIIYDPTWDDPHGMQLDVDVSQTNEVMDGSRMGAEEETDIKYCSDEAENEYSCFLYLEDGTVIQKCLVSYNRVGESYSITNDSHAKAAMNILRNSWFYDQLVDLVYEEMYPEIERKE